MTFGEAWVAMEQGKKVVRPEWERSVYYLKDKKIIEYDLVADKEYENEDIGMFGDEIFESDWKIVNENQQENTSEREKELIDKNAQLLNKGAEIMNENYELKKALAAVIDILRLYL